MSPSAPAQLPSSRGSAFGEYHRHGHNAVPQFGSRGSAVVSALTVSLPQTYQRCSPHFTYSHHLVPRRVLTKPSEGVENQGYDNTNSDLVVAVHDVFVSTTGARYVVKELLGQGTFGQVFRCVEQDSGGLVAVKVIKNQPAYYHQARVEVGVLQYLNTRADPQDKHHIVRMKDFFLFRNHLCLAFELLNLNLYELIRHNKFRGLSLALVRVFTTQILDALVVLRDSRIVHCDLKPENVLLKTIETGEVKVIDFGSACFENRTVYSYIQSRFYRSPEVVVGYPYTMAIDMWSLGCMAAELYLGLPLFPGACEHDLLCRMVTMLGPLPDFLLAHGKNTQKHYKLAGEDVVTDAVTGEAVLRRRYAVRNREEYEAATGQAAPVGKNYFQHTSLGDIIGAYPIRCGLSDEAVAREKAQREAFVDFLLGVLELDPTIRWTPRQAMHHPFITGEQFTGPFQPPADPSSNSGAAKRWDPSPSPTPVGTPMSIPATRTARPTTAAGGGTPWLPGMPGPGGGAATAAAIMASSPQVHAQAHAAAMAAVQAQMSLRQQQQQQQLGGTLGGGVANGYYLPPEYSAARSLQQIIPTLAAAMAASYGAASLGGTPMAHSLTAPLLSPPSRSFGPHLRYGDASGGGGGSWMGGGEGAGMGMGMGLPGTSLHTPRSAQAAFSPMQLGSFTPSSVTTYQAALAAAHVAMAQQQQQPMDAATLLSQSARMVQPATASSSYAQQQLLMQRSPYQGNVGAGSVGASRGGWGAQGSQLLAAQQAAAAVRAGLGPGAGAAHAALPPYLPQQQAAAGAGLLAGVGGREGSAPAGGGSRWVSMDGSLEGTPPRLGADGLAAAAGADECAPNPADWDPLWSDDLLEEESQGAGGLAGGGSGQGVRGGQGRMEQPSQKQSATQARGTGGGGTTAPVLYSGDWFREPRGMQVPQERHSGGGGQAAGHTGGSEAELPSSYSLPLPTALLLGLGGSTQQVQQQVGQTPPGGCAQQQQQQGGKGSMVQASGSAELPLPSSTLLGGPQHHQQQQAQAQQQARGNDVAQGSSGQSAHPFPRAHQSALQHQQRQQQGQRPGGGSVDERTQLATLLASAAQQQQQERQQHQRQQQQRQQQQQRPPWQAMDDKGAVSAAPALPADARFATLQYHADGTEAQAGSQRQQQYSGGSVGVQPPVSTSFEFQLGGYTPSHHSMAGSMQGGMRPPALPPYPPQQQQQQQEEDGQAALMQMSPAYTPSSSLTLPPSWRGAAAQPAATNGASGGLGTGGLDAVAAAAASHQQAVSAQLGTCLTHDLALSGLAGGAEEIAAALAAYQACTDPLQQQQLLAEHQRAQVAGMAVQAVPPQWAVGLDEQQQQLALRHNQPMQRMQGFDILK